MPPRQPQQGLKWDSRVRNRETETTDLEAVRAALTRRRTRCNMDRAKFSSRHIPGHHLDPQALYSSDVGRCRWKRCQAPGSGEGGNRVGKEEGGRKNINSQLLFLASPPWYGKRVHVRQASDCGPVPVPSDVSSRPSFPNRPPQRQNPECPSGISFPSWSGTRLLG